MKKKLLILYPSVALVCCMSWSCSQDNGPVYVEPESEGIQLTAEEALALHCSLNGSAISQAEIMNEASEIAANLDAAKGIVALKSGSRKVASLTPVTGVSPATKSGAEDTLAYIVSFGEGLGYTVLSADLRTDPVIVICPEGDLADDEESGAPSVESFKEGMKQAIARQIEIAEAKQDSLLAIALAKLEPVADSTGTETKAVSSSQIRTEYYYGEWQNKTQKGPFVKVTWAQGYPYNSKTPVAGNGKHCATGCAAVAAAQIMSYWKSPAGYDWSALTEDATPETTKAQTEVARLMIDVGNSMNTKYISHEVSSTSTIGAKKAYPNYGYEVGKLKRYDFEKVKSCINNGMPIHTTGFYDCLLKSDFLYWIIPSNGHAWVFDGLLYQQRTVTVRMFGGTTATKAKGTSSSSVFEGHYTESQYLLHCNWGWGGNQNGWYAEGVFDAEKGAEIPDSYDNKSIEGTNFQYGVKCIYDIHL